jgi:hypothetical protein
VDSNFLAMDENGANVFFTTREPLVQKDTDELVDLYDAREGGGFPESSPPIECEGDACQSLPPEPEDPGPATLLHNPGNPPLHFTKKHQKKPRHKKHHPRKHHKLRGHR